MTQETDGRHRKYYGMPELLLGNLAIAIWIILGSLSLALFYPLAAILFIAVAAFLVFYEIGKKGCVTCYYCKNCTVGMGKLPYLFFKREGTANVNKKAMKLFPFTFLLLSVLPIVLTIFSMLQEVTVLKVGLLVGLLVFSLYSGAVRAQSLRKSE